MRRRSARRAQPRAQGGEGRGARGRREGAGEEAAAGGRARGRRRRPAGAEEKSVVVPGGEAGRGPGGVRGRGCVRRAEKAAAAAGGRGEGAGEEAVADGRAWGRRRRLVERYMRKKGISEREGEILGG